MPLAFNRFNQLSDSATQELIQTVLGLWFGAVYMTLQYSIFLFVLSVRRPHEFINYGCMHASFFSKLHLPGSNLLSSSLGVANLMTCIRRLFPDEEKETGLGLGVDSGGNFKRDHVSRSLGKLFGKLYFHTATGTCMALRFKLGKKESRHTTWATLLDVLGYSYKTHPVRAGPQCCGSPAIDGRKSRSSHFLLPVLVSCVSSTRPNPRRSKH
jgi:hypothetical protein